MKQDALMGLLADARVKGDMTEVQRLQAYLSVDHRFFEMCLVPLYGEEKTAELLDEVEASKRRQRVEYEKTAPAPI